MMTCEQCLAELTTGSLREMSPDSPVMRHCASCPDCSHLTTLLRDREYNAANVLNNLPPMSNPITLAESSVSLAHRRRIGRAVVMLSGAALVVTIWIAAATTLFPALRRTEVVTRSELRTETISLSCLSPEQAASIIYPYVRSRGATYYLPSSGISAITVRGTATEVAKARSQIEHFEQDPGAACRHTLGSDLKMLQDEIFAAQKGAGAGAGDRATTVVRPAEPKEPVEPKVRP